MVRIDAGAAGVGLFVGEEDAFRSAINALSVIVPILFVGFVVLMCILAVVKARRLRREGISRLATNAEIVGDDVLSPAAQRPGMQPAAGTTQTLEARLAEIERLHGAGTITTAERDAARATVLGSL
jgi:hypothetical protein